MPSASPVSSASSSVSPRLDDHLAVGDELVAGLDDDDVAGHDLVGEELGHLAVADRLRLGGDEDRELVERPLRLQLLADPDVGVDDRDHPEERRRRRGPSSSIRTKKTPMIALKRVKTLPATMLETEREEVSGGAPRSWSRLLGLGAREAGGGVLARRSSAYSIG